MIRPLPKREFFFSAALLGLSLAVLAEWKGPFAFASPPPLCPASLRGDDPDFAKLAERCDFNRKRLPACPEGLPSLDPVARDWMTNYPVPNPQRRECAKEWTVIAYLAMDNNLSEFGEENMDQIALGKALDKRNGIDVVAQAEFRQRAGRRYVFEASDTRLGVSAAAVEDFGGKKQDTGDKRTLESFLAWAVEQFPARHYALIMGGHGDGWAATIAAKPTDKSQAPAAPSGTLPPTPTITDARLGNGIAYDETFHDWLTMNELRRTLARVSEKLMGSEPFDLYAADACLMQQAEVAFELRKQARFIFGSIPVMPTQGLPYYALLSNLVAGKYPDGRALALDLPRLTVDSYKATNGKVYASSVESATLGTELPQSLLALGRAGRAWLGSSTNVLMDKFTITSAISDAITHQDSIVELRDFLIQLDTELAQATEPGGQARPGLAEFQAAIAETKHAVADVVIASAWGTSYDALAERMQGLSIWMPANIPAYSNFADELLHSNLHRIGCDCATDKDNFNDWGLFLKAVFDSRLASP